MESLCVPHCKDWVVIKATDKLLKPCSLERNNMFPQHVPAPPNPHIACWQNGSHFVSSETQLRWQIETMGHRMKNYGLAAGPRSTLHLCKSEESKQSAQLREDRIMVSLYLHEIQC